MRAPVLAVSGLAREARIASGAEVETIQAGGRPERLRARLAAREGSAPRAVLSFGIAGGLDPALAPGDIVVGSGVWTEAHYHPAASALVARLASRLTGLAGGRVVVADLAGVETAVLTPAAKVALRMRTGAAAVDMESQVAAVYAAERALPFAAIRVVCDPAQRALPLFAASALTPDGEPDIRAVLGAMLRGRARIGDLIRLGRDSSTAFAALARCRAKLGPELGLA